MIPNQWYVVLDSSEVRRGKLTGVTRMGEKMVAWRNWLGDKMHLLIAFTPVDDANTMMYIRAYQSFVKTPLLREIINWIGQWGNFIIERQDRRPVTTQRPSRSDLKIGEKLTPSDGPIIEYRRRRRALIEAGGGR